MRKIQAIAASLALTCTLAVSTLPTTEAQAATSPAPRAELTRPIRGAQFTVSGKLSTPVARPIELQKKVGSHWQRLKTGTTAASGKYRFSVSTSSSVFRLRVVAQKIKIKGRNYTRLVSKITKIRTVSVTPSAPTKSETFIVKDSLRVPGVRRVILQRKVGKTWKKIASARTTKTGVFAIAARVSSASSLRVQAPKATVQHRRRPAVTLTAFRVTPARQRGSITMPATAAVNTRLTATAHFTPARAGRNVQLQRLTGSQWKTVASATQNRSGTATLTTTPTQTGAATYRAVTTARQGAAAVVTSAVTVTVSATVSPLSITVDTPAEATVGQDFYAALIAVGGRAPYSWTATGLPPGISLSADGKLSGRPTIPDTYTTHLTALDADSHTASADLTINVTAALSIDTVALPVATVDQDYSLAASATGGTTPYTWTALSLPTGLSMSSGGQISGTTSALGSYDVTLSVTDALSRSASTDLTLIVAEPLEISTASLPAGRTGSSYDTTLAATGGVAPYSWVATGLPTGLSLSTGGALTGTPTQAGTFTAGITVTDHAGASASTSLELGITAVTIDALAAGDDHSCAVASTGTAKCWGYNNNGQLGTGDQVNRTAPTAVSGLTEPVKAVANGTGFSCALTQAGGVYCWGLNNYGQLGHGDTLSHYTPVEVTGLSDVTAISAGSTHACALTTGGGVKCWGGNTKGQLGDGTTTRRLTAVDVSGLSSGVTGLDAGAEHNCVVTAGIVKCWGANASGQLGLTGTTYRTTPISVTGLAADVTAVTAGGSHNCSVSPTQALQCWGGNAAGQLGDGTTTNTITPVSVTGLAGTTSMVVAGTSHTCAVSTSGQTQCWGANDLGQLGDGSTTASATPVQVSGLTSAVTTITAGTNHTCAVSNAVDISCWGNDARGQLGDGGGYLQTAPIEVTGVTDAAQLATVNYATCMVTTSGGVQCWGRNNYGQLGNGTTVNTTAPVAVTGLSHDVATVAGGDEFACALTTEGSVQCWGRNNYGQLGNGSNTDSTIPVQVTGLESGVSAISIMAAHVCALTTEGSVKCWGRNNYSQLGDATTTNRSTPVTVPGLPSGIAAVTTGSFHSCVLSNAGTVSCWGDNSVGQIGDGTTTLRTTATAATGLTGPVARIQAGYSFTCAVTMDGKALCWGQNTNAQLSDGTTTNRTAAVEVKGLTGTPAAISGGISTNCALSTAGAAQCWGSSNFGTVGDGTVTFQRSPVDVLNLGSGVSQMGAVRATHTCAVKESGAVACWGYNDYGQLGHITNVSTVPVATHFG
ncbi:MAG TPA: putative Ig domain-containing protein [Propionicimonas sp.]|nr:putative Ig domain-containing protein [Propionicimonas sp.]